MARAILGIFSEPSQADETINELKNLGFKNEDISVVMKERENESSENLARGAEVARDASSGITTGGAIGGIAGLIIGIAAISVPGLGALIAAGPLAIALGLGEIGVATLAGLITGAAAGGMIGGLVGLGIPREQAKIYEEAVRKGQVLLSVSTTEENERLASETFKKFKATEVCSIEGAKLSKEVK